MSGSSSASGSRQDSGSSSASGSRQALSGSEGQLRITQVRSLIGRNPGQRRTVRALGLRRIRHTVVQPDRPEIRGMVRKVAHLIEVEEIETEGSGT